MMGSNIVKLSTKDGDEKEQFLHAGGPLPWVTCLGSAALLHLHWITKSSASTDAFFALTLSSPQTSGQLGQWGLWGNMEL